jgi:RNA polymerase primary sigma factor
MPELLSRKNRPTQSPLAIYLREINETPLLTAIEEKALAYRIQDNGDTEARDHLVRANLRLVVNLARGYLNRGLDLPDLIEEGNLGLLRAVEGFDADMGTRFSTYAAYWIRQSMKRAVVNCGKTVRVPAYMAELMTKWRRATAELQDELGRAPTEDEVAEALGLPRKKLKVIKKALRIYNATPHGTGPDAEQTLDRMLADDRVQAPDAALAESDDLAQVLGLLDKMEEREAAVLRMRFGLDNEEPRTLKEIGECLGLTRERVRQIQDAALSALREGLVRG